VVLLVEDFSELRSTLAEVLKREGFLVVEARDGREAVDRARSVLPDVIVMDLSMPIFDGAAAAGALKTYALTSRIPIVAFTGLSVSASEARALGLDDVIRKPCTPEELVSRLRALLGPKRALEETR
jgi:CheY-like chemotaxis protein